jgi:hypothetical protein
MALDQCPDCSGTMPDEAMCCPHCGWRAESRADGDAFFGDIAKLLIVVAGFFLYAWWNYFRN